MQRCELLEHALVGARTGLGPFLDGQLEFFEEDLPELLGRVDVEFVTGQLVDFGRRVPPVARRPTRPAAQFRRIEPDAGVFHFGQDRDQRPFEVPVEVPEVVAFEFLGDQSGHLPRHVGVLAGVLGHLVVSISAIDFWFLPFPIRSLIGIMVWLRYFSESAASEWLRAPASSRKCPIIGSTPMPSSFKSGPFQHQHVVLDVLVGLLDLGVLDHRPQRITTVSGSSSFDPCGPRTGRYQP